MIILARYRAHESQDSRAQLRGQFRPRLYNFLSFFDVLCAYLCVGAIGDFGSGGLIGRSRSRRRFKSSPCTQFISPPSAREGFLLNELRKLR